MEGTESQLNLDGTLLRMAQELAGDVAAVYHDAPESIKRGYNQAFFRKLKVQPVWDDEQGEPVVQVVEAELTKPYSVLLADSFTERVRKAVALVGSGKGKTKGNPDGAALWRSVFDLESYGGERGTRTPVGD